MHEDTKCPSYYQNGNEDRGSHAKAPFERTRLDLLSLSPVFKKRGFRQFWAAFFKMRPKKTQPEHPVFCSGRRRMMNTTTTRSNEVSCVECNLCSPTNKTVFLKICQKQNLFQ